MPIRACCVFDTVGEFKKSHDIRQLFCVLTCLNRFLGYSTAIRLKERQALLLR
jgi:hypothetical protein